MINKRTYFQAFIIHLQLKGINFKEANTTIYLSQSNKRYFLEMIIDENGTFEALLTDLAAATFVTRDHGEWNDANDLKQRLQVYLDILQKAE